LIANFLIGLREGIEAALIVGILVGSLVKSDRRNSVKAIFFGVFAAIATALLSAFVLNELVASVPEGVNELISGISSIAAVVFVTFMIYWMARQSRSMAGNLRGKIDAASGNSTFALAMIAYLAVVREGVETAIFIWSAAKTTAAGDNPVLGATLGLALAAALGYLFYRGSLKLNLKTFFRYTGAYLILVAAAILAYGLGELQAIGVLPILTATAYDVTGVIHEGSTIDTVLRGTIGFNSAPTILQTLGYGLYLLPTAWFYFKPRKTN
jgi:high-affinity iron transporter